MGSVLSMNLSNDHPNRAKFENQGQTLINSPSKWGSTSFTSRNATSVEESGWLRSTFGCEQEPEAFAFSDTRRMSWLEVRFDSAMSDCIESSKYFRVTSSLAIEHGTHVRQRVHLDTIKHPHECMVSNLLVGMILSGCPSRWMGKWSMHRWDSKHQHREDSSH